MHDPSQSPDTLASPDARAKGHAVEPHGCHAEEGLVIRERDDKSTFMSILHTIVKPFRPRLSVPKLKKQPSDLRLTVPHKARKIAFIEGREVEGIWVYDMSSKMARPAGEQHRRRILYFPGGSWQMPPSPHHWALGAELTRRMVDTAVTIVSCPLAPQHPVADAFPRIERAYAALLAQAARAGETVIVAGDSSGGNLALCLSTWTLMNRGADEEGAVPPPAAVMAICATTDLRHELEEIRAVDRLDPMMNLELVQSAARTWCPAAFGDEGGKPPATGEIGGATYRLDWSFSDPRVSPVQGDVGVLARHGVRLYGITATHDVLGPEADAYMHECKKKGVQGEWLVWKGQMHCFPLAWRFHLRESREAVDWITDMCKRH